ncbi:LPXTG cell wall anchor domain-containing protein [Aerococcaceae bacterium DSM 111020]|nr:LPXTG cell wall anchor domain-containing protein [Aerococcaceae bacterium DSM 111020]
MKQKLFSFIITLSSMILFSQNTITALEQPEPYVLTRFITMVPLEKERTIELIKSAQTSQTYNEQIAAEEASLLHQMETIQQEYEQLNQTIQQLEYGEQNSLVVANLEMESVIEQLYDQALHEYEGFNELSAEEQLRILSENEAVIEWQNYLNDIQNQLNELISHQKDLENYYYQLQYEYESLNLNQETEIDEQALNQSLMYPYAMDYLNPNTILLNQEASLEDYLVQIHQYLNHFVPDAYRKVRFDQIYEIFQKQMSPDDLNSILANKNAIQFDEESLHYYTYAHELSLQDIETVAQFGLDSYYKTNDLEGFHRLYNQVIQTKEGQYQYFKAINEDAYETLQSQLVSYLNNKEAWNQDAIKKVQNLQSKHQIKLVFFDEDSNQWHKNSTGTSGFYDSYYNRRLDLSEIVQVDEDQTFTVGDHDNEVNAFEEDNENNHGLNSLKGKLMGTGSGSSNKLLPKPNTRPKLNTKGQSSGSSDESTKGRLPNTGESTWLNWVAIGLVVIAIVLLIVNRYIHRREMKKYHDTKLD